MTNDLIHDMYTRISIAYLYILGLWSDRDLVYSNCIHVNIFNFYYYSSITIIIVSWQF